MKKLEPFGSGYVSPEDVPGKLKDHSVADYYSRIRMPLEVIKADGYFKCLELLRSQYDQGLCDDHPTIIIDGQNYVRPLTMREIAEARICYYDDFVHADGHEPHLRDRLKLMSEENLHSCSALLYHQDKVKFVPLCKQLVTLRSDDLLTLDYSSYDGVELSLDSKLEDWYSVADVRHHPNWLAVFEGDSALLERYCELMLICNKFLTRFRITHGFRTVHSNECVASILSSDGAYPSGFKNPCGLVVCRDG